MTMTSETSENSCLQEVEHLQIELTSRCNLNCTSCVRSHFHSQWQEWDLSEMALEKILSSISGSTSVHLQGWGEILLRRDVPLIVSRFKQKGCRVSISSNGTVMSHDLAGKLIDAGIDSMTFSLAGSKESTHDLIRGQGSFMQTMKSIRLFASHNVGSTKKVPLVINYLLTPENFRDLTRMVLLCRKIGVKLLVGTHMIHVCSDTQRQMVSHIQAKDFRKYLVLAQTAALICGIRLSIPPLTAKTLPVCAKSPLEALFIGADGTVSPCVYLCPPLTGGYPKLQNGEYMPNHRILLGNLNQTSLKKIWESKQSVDFRKKFKKRFDIYDQTIPQVGPDFEGLERLLKAADRVDRLFCENPPPAPCRGCPKLFGF